MTIAEFKGEYRWLSNFHPEPARGGYSNEHFFQAEKTLVPVERAAVMLCETPGQAKRAGRKVTLRDDWDAVKDSVMLSCLRSKFYADRDLFVRLMETEDDVLIEGNTWGDTYWGVDLNTGDGLNRLGLLLMNVREELRELVR